MVPPDVYVIIMAANNLAQIGADKHHTFSIKTKVDESYYVTQISLHSHDVNDVWEGWDDLFYHSDDALSRVSCQKCPMCYA